MTERPILFSAPMVRAILDGRKSQTRRVLKPQPSDLADIVHAVEGHAQWAALSSSDHGATIDRGAGKLLCKPGDLLWVREAWRTLRDYDALSPGQIPSNGAPVFYEANSDGLYPPCRLRPSIHMPRWASRITLKVTAVKVERLQDISEADAVAEGIQRQRELNASLDGWNWLDPRDSFRSLWQSINGPDSWDATPWVAAYSFERIKP